MEDKEYAQLLKDQLEVYQQRIELFIKEKENVKYMMEEEMPNMEKGLADTKNILELLKADRTKDQMTIFELERKIGLLQVHYTYDRSKLMNNADVLFETI